MNTEINDNEGKVTIVEDNKGLKKITVKPFNQTFIPITNCQTIYPDSLIKLIFETKGASYLCDEICRDIDPNYVQRDLQQELTAYFAPADFAGKKILDFGCGSGASSMILARMFPDAQIVGIELEEKLLRIARARLDFYQYPNIEFFLSPSGNELPTEIGEFEFVIMSAVYEHLLPVERKTVMPQVWLVIKPRGYLFLNMTPHRWFPIEHHTTGLPFLNYLPDKIAFSVTKRFSKRTDPNESWEKYLRRGIRGGTENEILEILADNSENKPQLIEPCQNKIKDRIDLWYSQLNQNSRIVTKKIIKNFIKAFRSVSGLTIVPNLSLVIKKH